MTEKHEIQSLPKILLKGVLVIGIAFLLAFGMNTAMQSFLDSEMEVVQAAADRAAEIERQLEEANSEAEQKRLEAELAVKKAEQYEEFYQQYNARDNYQCYGQFYEMYQNMYAADTIIIGTSHATHGINPLYLEESITDRSFFNFALNGTNPQYYVDWFQIFEESGYPKPKTILFSVDWFMFDEVWLWRRIEHDTNPDCPENVSRRLKKLEESMDAYQKLLEERENGDEPAETAADPAPAEVTPEKMINYFDIDEVTTLLFSRIPIIYSRDRIPEMIGYYLGKSTFESAVVNTADVQTEALDPDTLPEVPVYEHEVHQDSQGNLTNEYYKGYITWQQPGYSGEKVTKGCRMFDNQVEAFRSLLDMFREWGCEVIFVETPEYLAGRTTTHAEPNNKMIADIADEYGISFFNYNEELASEINEDHSNYSDWGHMNGQGAAAFSKLLGKDLAAYWDKHK